jgi:hypothetical protein
VGLWIIILTVWLPIADIMLALCLYDMTRDMLKPAAERTRHGDVNSNPADEP